MKRAAAPAVLGLFIVAGALHAQESGVFLKLPVSARAGALGDASTALADEPLGLYHNPAGMAFIKRPAAAFVHHKYLQDIGGNSAAVVLPFGNIAFGLAYTAFGMKKEPIYDSFGNDTGRRFGYESRLPSAGTAVRVGNLAAGFAAKRYSEDMGFGASVSNAYDLGAIYRRGALSFGAAAQNLGGRLHGYDLVRIRRAGAAYGGGRFTAAADYVKMGEEKGFIGLGGALLLTEIVVLRGGWRIKDEFGGLTFGLGLPLGAWNLDYAFTGYGDLGNAHKAGVTLSFGAGKPRPESGKRGPERPRAQDTPPAVPSAAGTPDPGQVRNVAVVDFVGKNVSQADASIVAGFIRTELVNTGRVNVMERNNMDAILAEQKFQNSGCTEQECAAQIGKLLNVSRMVLGTLSRLLDTYYITVSLVDVETGKVLASYDAEAGHAGGLKEACGALAGKLAAY